VTVTTLADREVLRAYAPGVRAYRTQIELRASADASSSIREFFGHACVTGFGYEMYGGPENGGWTEFVDPGAFTKTLRENPDVVFLENHDGGPLAKTTVGDLRLAEDKIGLAANADLDTKLHDAAQVALRIDKGYYTEMSFAFTTIRQMWLNAAGEEVPWWDMSGIERHLMELNINKGDVSVVNYGANDATSAHLRSLSGDAAIADLRAGRPLEPAKLAVLEARCARLADHDALAIRSRFAASFDSAPPQPPAPEPAVGMSLLLARAYVQGRKIPA
jgi:HK97 family phage prohead protease